MKTTLLVLLTLTQSAFALDTEYCPNSFVLSYRSIQLDSEFNVLKTAETAGFKSRDVLEDFKILQGISTFEYRKLNFKLISTQGSVCHYRNMDATPIKGREHMQETRLLTRKGKNWLRVALTVSSNYGDSVYWVYHQVEGLSKRMIYVSTNSGALYGFENKGKLEVKMGYANQVVIND